MTASSNFGNVFSVLVASAFLPFLPMLPIQLLFCGVVLPFSFLGPKLGLEPLPASYFSWLVMILLSYSLLTQAMKGWYIRRFGTWL